MSADVRIEFQSGDQFTWKEMNVMVAGTKEPDTTDVQTRVDSKAGTAAAIDEITTLDQKMWQAIIDIDIATLDRILADDFIGVYDDGTDPDNPIWTKQRVLKTLKSRDDVISSYTYDKSCVHVNGNAATISGLVTMKERYKGEDISGQHRFTSTWSKCAGHWQCVGENYVLIAGHAQSAGDKQAVVDELMRLMKASRRAVLAKDFDALASIYADEFIGVYAPQGQVAELVSTKTGFLSAMKAGKLEILAVDHKRLDVTVSDDGRSAAMMGWIDVKFRMGDVTADEKHWATILWTKKPAGWQIVTEHGVILPDGGELVSTGQVRQ
jgi:ketosteroid isomerase-like protein